MYSHCKSFSKFKRGNCSFQILPNFTYQAALYSNKSHPHKASHKMKHIHTIDEYDAMHKHSIENPTAFWAEQAEKIDWFKKWDEVLDNTNPPFYKWFPGAQSNMCFNALDRHVRDGHGDQLACVYDSPVSGTKVKLTFSELLEEVKVFARGLTSLGAKKGDVIMIYMPMTYKALVAMLACARIGAIHCVTFGGFAPAQLAVRIDHSKPVILLTASNGYSGVNKPILYEDLIKEGLELSKHKIQHVVLFQREYPCSLGPNYIDWNDLCKKVASLPDEPCAVMEATDPLYLVYTSGTTGEPKGIIRDTGGYMVSLSYSMSHIYGCQPGDVFFACSDIGWILGHSYIVYGPLLNRNTTVFFEGKPVGTPDPGTFFRVCSEYGVKIFFTAPTAFRMIRKEDPTGSWIKKYDLSKLKALFLAGERSDPTTLEWAQNHLNIDVVDNYWQTETGWPMISNFIHDKGTTFSPKLGSATKPVPGYHFSCLDDEGNHVEANELGNLVVKLPLPPGCFPTLFQNPKKYVSSYFARFPGFYETSDSGVIDQDGYISIMTRTDDIINVNGVRISTGALEEIILQNKNVAECAVVGIDNKFSGQIPIALIVTADNHHIDHDNIAKEIVQSVRVHFGKFTHLLAEDVIPVKLLPKSRSGKVLRNVIRNIANGKPPNAPATIEDHSVIDTLQVLFEKIRKTNSE